MVMSVCVCGWERERGGDDWQIDCLIDWWLTVRVWDPYIGVMIDRYWWTDWLMVDCSSVGLFKCGVMIDRLIDWWLTVQVWDLCTRVVIDRLIDWWLTVQVWDLCTRVVIDRLTDWLTDGWLFRCGIPIWGWWLTDWLTVDWWLTVQVWDPYTGVSLCQLESPRYSPAVALQSIPAPSPLVLMGTTEATLRSALALLSLTLKTRVNDEGPQADSAIPQSQQKAIWKQRWSFMRETFSKMFIK